MSTFIDYTDILPDPSNKIGTGGQATVALADVQTENSNTSTATVVIKRKNNDIRTGMTVSGTGITGSQTVSSISSDGLTITLSANINATVPANTELTFTEVSGAGGTAGVGFKNVSFSSNAPIMRSRTNSGRLITRSNMYHKWDIKVSYNPMIQSQFNVIYPFLVGRQGTLKPFFVKLPQYGSGTDLTVASATVGSQTLTTQSGQTTAPTVGSIFTIIDSSDSNHTKAYMITKVENNTYHNSTLGTVASNTQRITFVPGLQKAVSAGSTMELSNPMLKVILKNDATPYSVDTNNLYSLSLQLEEVTT